MKIDEFSLDDVNAIEGHAGSQLEYCAAIQRAINAGMWSLQGSYGRAMMQAIEEGRCMLGPVASRDYWGNQIPARSNVQDGTMGSKGFVAKQCGEDWAEKMDSV